MDSVLQFLQMGTWSVIGDFRRVYRGPDLTYNGWQRASNTTPDALFGADSESEEQMPAWARRFQENERESLGVDCTPSQSRDLLISHVTELFPDAARSRLEKIF